jgi:hypothetical protein
MRWIKASEKPPTGNAEDYSWRRVKDKVKFNPILNINGNILEYAWLRSEFSFDEVEYLDESDTPTHDLTDIEREAAELYPEPNYPIGRTEVYSLSELREYRRQAHIACAKQYIDKVKGLEAEVAAWKDASELYFKYLSPETKEIIKDYFKQPTNPQ